MAVVATGFFDGVHLGHRQVIRTLVSSARERGEEAIVVTFAPHPRAVLQQDAHSLRDVLIGRFGATALVLGFDNRLGSDRLTPDAIAPIAESLGLSVIVVAPAAAASLRGNQPQKTSGDAGPLPLPSEAGPSLLRSRGWLRFSEAVAVSTTPAAAVSSTKIRKALEKGRVEDAEEMLGYAYGLRGVVVSGKQLGRTLGFPTANLRLYDPMKLIPARGVYLTEVEVLGGHYWGMTNVGDIIETHIFDFSEDIYGLDLEIRFRRWLRAMRNMASLDALKTQLAADEAACRELLKSI